MEMWISAALPYIGGGVFGAALTYGLTWLRERRRTLDAYRSPQRQAIAGIVAATHEYMSCELEQRMLMEDLIRQIREDRLIVTAEQSDAAMKASGRALLAVERAFQVGRLTIVDAPCWKAMGIAYVDFSQLSAAMGAGANMPELDTPEQFEGYIEGIKALAENFNRSVLAIVIAAADRLAPAETRWNWFRRRGARRRIGEHHQRALTED